jgi:uncharacterized protein YbjT (DUF2867 family)
MILVTGATGNVGREVAADLARRGEPVRALVRDPAKASLPVGVHAVAGDLVRPESVRSAFRDVDRLFLLPGYPGVARAAADAGVARIVQLSGGSAGSGDQSNAVTRYMERSEQEVREAEVEWTFLRPCAFMSNTLRWLPQLAAGDVVRAPFGDVPVASVDPADIAAVAVVALVEDGHHAMIYRPTGPESLAPRRGRLCPRAQPFPRHRHREPARSGARGHGHQAAGCGRLHRGTGNGRGHQPPFGGDRRGRHLR